MADVFISYARPDADRVRPLSGALHAAGLDVWLDPSAPLEAEAAARDPKLGAAPAVLVFWSGASCSADHVLMEAVTAMGGRKLIQVRLDDVSPPSPFDRLPVHDLSGWEGDPAHPGWIALRGALEDVRRTSEAGMARRAGANGAAMGKASYLEKPRLAAGTVAGLLLALVLLGGVSAWMLAPPAWRAMGESLLARATAVNKVVPPIEVPSEPASDELAGMETRDAASLAAQTALRSADLTRPEDLRALVTGYPGTESAETALALLRAIDARSWGEAVVRDTEEAYVAYLEAFPGSGAVPGRRAKEASERIASLGLERSQAVADIQRALRDAGLYAGAIDGQTSATLQTALKAVSGAARRAPPDLASAAPRELRALSDVIRSGLRSSPSIPTFDAEAGAEADAAAWLDAARINTPAAYEAYLEAYPAGLQATAAREALSVLRKAPPFGVVSLDPDVRRAVLFARNTGAEAVRRAEAARAKAASVSQGEGGYRGELDEGGASGLGVSEYSAGSELAPSGALRFEGEHAAGEISGLGVIYWRNGDTLAGRLGPDRSGSGVLQFANGQRYEGEIRQGRRSGLGVLWTASGDPIAVGRWTEDALSAPIGVVPVQRR